MLRLIKVLLVIASISTIATPCGEDEAKANRKASYACTLLMAADWDRAAENAA